MRGRKNNFYIRVWEGKEEKKGRQGKRKGEKKTKHFLF
jgi:hypothetical protein